MMGTLPLHQISGVSKFNARHTPPTDEEIAELQASILEHGVTTPLLLRVEDRKCVALDGGRRFLALRGLAERGEIDVGFPVPHLMFEGDDEAAAEVSLISFVQRRDLHPVDEFERFEELTTSFGLGPEEIAKKTGKSLRFVKERLRLSRLAPKVRDAWREGRIVAETARAFSASESHEVQEQIFAEYEEVLDGVDLNEIRDELRGDAVRASNRLAVFVGADSYAAAGGRLDEQLFEDDTWFLDGALLKRLAEEKLERLGAEIVAREGWAWACYDHKDALLFHNSPFVFDASDGDYTEDENDRLGEIESLPSWEREARGDEIDDEIDEITARAVVRAIPADDRASQGVYLTIDSSGRVEVERGVVYGGEGEENEENREAGGEGGTLPARGAGQPRSSSVAPPASATPSEPIGKPLRAVLDETVDAALADVVSRNVSLALVFAVARLGCSYGGESLELSAGFGRSGRKPTNDLLRKIAAERFDQALYLCVAAHLEDPTALPIAFAHLVSDLFNSGKATSFDTSRILLAIASRMSDVEGALDRALDREAYFKATPKDDIVEAIRAIDGDAAANDARKLKKGEAVQRAALLATDRHWLPAELLSALRAPPKDERTTAEAMRDAIEADEVENDAVEADEDQSEDDAAAETTRTRMEDLSADAARDAPSTGAAGQDQAEEAISNERAA